MDTDLSNGKDKAHKRFAQKFHGLSSPTSMNPKLGHAAANLHNNTAVKTAILLFVLGGVYLIGYNKGLTFQNNSLTSSHTTSDSGMSMREVLGSGLALSEFGSKKDMLQKEKEAADLEAIEHMQGFSDAYPTYQNNEAGEHPAQVDEVDENEVAEASLRGLDSDGDGNELVLADSDADDQTDDIVDITSDLSEEELFEDYDAFTKAPYITVPSIQGQSAYNLPYKLPRKNLWWALKAYEKQYRLSPIKNHVPRIKRNIQLTLDEFHKRFRRPAQPVLFNFENLRSLGFPTKNYTLSQLKTMFPYDAQSSGQLSEVQSQFVANGIRKTEEELDLGPGLAAIERDEELAKQGRLRSYPRNLKVKQDAIAKLNIQKPPLVKDMEQFQLPTLWMGTSSSDTRFHHDCCDNFVMMISGTKRFTLAPTSDWRVLNPQCIGKYKSLCWANVINPNAPLTDMTPKERVTMKNVHKMVVDVGPGDILYMPAGWFHHIQNLGPTVMVNWWTKSHETCALTKAKVSPNY